jgi:hypothetical protein
MVKTLSRSVIVTIVLSVMLKRRLRSSVLLLESGYKVSYCFAVRTLNTKIELRSFKRKLKKVQAITKLWNLVSCNSFSKSALYFFRIK